MTENDVVFLKLMEQISEHDPSATECFVLGYISAVNDMNNVDRRAVIEQFISNKRERK